jgi:heat shock protein HslJ
MIRCWITRNRLFLLLMLLPMLVQCTAAKQGTAPAPAEALQFDKGQVWQLVSLRGKGLSRQDGVFTLTFNPEAGTLSGQMPCNGYYADFSHRLLSLSEAGCRYALAIESLGSGQVACPEADMNAEQRYLALLPRATACVLTPYSLTLFQKDKELMKFELQ